VKAVDVTVPGTLEEVGWAVLSSLGALCAPDTGVTVDVGDGGLT
jgi:hypothetical protein